jgi:hypothetical protein
VVQRLGVALWIISFGLVVLAFNAPGMASVRYDLFVLAHGCLYTGYLTIAIGDALAHRRFSSKTFTLAIVWWFLLVTLGPVAMSAAAAR